jgi:hypothetical protein
MAAWQRRIHSIDDDLGYQFECTPLVAEQPEGVRLPHCNSEIEVSALARRPAAAAQPPVLPALLVCLVLLEFVVDTEELAAPPGMLQQHVPRS